MKPQNGDRTTEVDLKGGHEAACVWALLPWGHVIGIRHARSIFAAP